MWENACKLLMKINITRYKLFGGKSDNIDQSFNYTYLKNGNSSSRYSYYRRTLTRYIQ